MIVTKWVDVSKEVEVEIEVSLDDITRAIRQDTEREEMVLIGINNTAGFFRAIPDDVIAGLKDKTKKVIADFLEEQMKRFQETIHKQDAHK